METSVKLAVLITLMSCHVQNLDASTKCGNSSGGRCSVQGCWYNDVSYICEPCYNCSVKELQDGHPRECRGLPFPTYCEQVARGGDIATSIPKLHIPDNRQGNFGQNGDRWVVFAYTEEAEEHPGVTYSRVAKVCKHEWNQNSSDWVTFQKARLRCSSDDYGEYNYIENIIRITLLVNDKETSYYYAVFTKSRSNYSESAVCTFTTKSVRMTMRGEFSDPLSERSGTGYTNAVKDIYMPRDFVPGSCNGADLNDWQTTFMRTHPLMFDIVETEDFLYKGWGRFTRLSSDTKETLSGDSYLIIFIGTGDGRLLKLVQLKNGGVNVLEEIYLTPVAAAITELEIVPTDSGKMVRVLSNSSDEPLTVPVQRCANMTVCACTQDPYCVWNLNDQLCEEFSDNLSGDQFNQSVEERRTCSRNKTHPALLITSYRIPPTTMIPTTIKEQEINKVSAAPLDKSIASQQNEGFDLMWIVVPIVGSLVVIALIIGILVYRKYRQNICLSTSARLKYSTSMTSITLEPLCMSDIPKLKLKGSNAECTMVKTCMGRIKLKFENLTPRTRYTIMKDGDDHLEVITEGPNVQVVNVTKYSISVKISDWSDDFTGLIKLTSQEWSREKHFSFRGPSGTIFIDGLLPNIKYFISLEMKYGSPRTTSYIPFGTVKTEEETFLIEPYGDSHILKWDGVPEKISELHIAPCCNPSVNITVDARRQFAELKNLCQVEDLNIEVKGKLQSSGSSEPSVYVMATLCCDVRPSGAWAALLCQSTMQDLQNDIEFRKALSLLFKTEVTYCMFCRTLGYNKEESLALFKGEQSPEEKFMRALHDKNEEEHMCISVKALLSNFENLYNKRKSSSKDLKECHHTFSIMEKLASFEPSCEACDAIFKRVKHSWVCRGLKNRLPENC